MRRAASRGSSSSLFPRSLAVRPSNLLPAAALFAILFFFFLERQSRLLQVRPDCVTTAHPRLRLRHPLSAHRSPARSLRRVRSTLRLQGWRQVTRAPHPPGCVTSMHGCCCQHVIHRSGTVG